MVSSVPRKLWTATTTESLCGNSRKSKNGSHQAKPRIVGSLSFLVRSHECSYPTRHPLGFVCFDSFFNDAQQLFVFFRWEEAKRLGVMFPGFVEVASCQIGFRQSL